MKIIQISGREIYDSQGIPTVECTVVLENGASVAAAVPAGRSKSQYEAQELRDGGSRLGGMGVLKAVENIENIIAPALLGKKADVVALDIEMIDLDGTNNKSRLGANAILATSMAIARAQATSHNITLFELIAALCESESVSIPLPLINLINGGMHADSKNRIQEILVLPLFSESFCHAIERTVELNYALGNLLRERGYRPRLGVEGGYVADFTSEVEPLDILLEAMNRIGATNDFQIGLDVAASTFFNPETHTYQWNDQEQLTSQEMIQLYINLTNKYPIFSLEDPLAQDDWEGWTALYHTLGDTLQLVGDDIFATNPERIARALEQPVANAAIIKPTQIGTITETLQAIQVCREGGLQTIVSRRSGETEDSFICELAVGANAREFKGGGCMRNESISKYNQLMRLEDYLHSLEEEDGEGEEHETDQDESTDY